MSEPIESRLLNAPYVTSVMRREAAEEIKRLRDALTQSCATVKQLLSDQRRLDWLADQSNSNGHVMLPKGCVERHPESLRAAIDMAMEISE